VVLGSDCQGLEVVVARIGSDCPVAVVEQVSVFEDPIAMLYAICRLWLEGHVDLWLTDCELLFS